MFIKICGITNEDDALLAVALGADAVGFIFAPSTRQVAAQRVFDITRRLPPEILTVGVFRDEAPARVVELVKASGVKAAQLHGHETPEMTRAVKAEVRFVIQAFPAGSSGLARADEHGADVIMRRLAQPGFRPGVRLGAGRRGPGRLPHPLAGGLTPENVTTAIYRVGPWGVDVSTGVEREPGRKDPVKLKAFIEAARAAAPEPYRGPDALPYDWADE